MSESAIAVLRGVSFSVLGKQIIPQLSLSIRAGEVLSLVGPNGAGKSTVLGLLAGDLKADQGLISLAGKELGNYSSRELARRRAVALQDSKVSYAYSVEEVVRMGRLAWRGSDLERHDDAIVKESLQRTETANFSHREVTTLSGGEMARTTLGRVLAQDTKFLLLDEPTAALDVRHQEAALTICRQVAESGGAAVVVLHDLDLAASYSDRMVLLDQGRVVAAGTPEQVCDAELLSRVYRSPMDVFAHPRTGRLVVLPARNGSIDAAESLQLSSSGKA